jgi:hypothetical protein
MNYPEKLFLVLFDDMGALNYWSHKNANKSFQLYQSNEIIIPTL